MLNVNIVQKTVELLKKAEYACLGLLDERGSPTVSAVSIIERDGMETLWFSTSLNSNKVRRIRRDSRAGVCVVAGGGNITLTGDVELLTDSGIKAALWQPWFIDHFPGGKDDPDYCILKFTARRASLYVDGEGTEFDLADIASPSSRCGLLCAACAYRASHNCAGCFETGGHPFHGACPIALCCQGKGFEHCGQCPDAPCAQLTQYSCGDPEHGDNPAGARIEMVKRWAKRA